ncbi:BTB/POZ domain-containing protein [Ditylenchus destructor]|nr:BTB/POZ domain-containing protein [Ditylenchus destructor]
MSENISTSSSDWIRLNVGGQIFQTTKDTLSRCPDSFLARLVNCGIPSDKDESGAYLIDADPEHFRTILNYLRRGSVKLDGSKMNLEDLLREADFYNIRPLADKIREAISRKSEDPIKDVANKISDEIASVSSALSDIREAIVDEKYGTLYCMLKNMLNDIREAAENNTCNC